MSREIRALGFSPDGVSVEYLDFTTDVKTNGLLMNHALLVPDNTAFHDELETLRLAAMTFLDRVLGEWIAATAVPIPEPADTLDVSPYDNPTERDLGGVR